MFFHDKMAKFQFFQMEPYSIFYLFEFYRKNGYDHVSFPIAKKTSKFFKYKSL